MKPQEQGDAGADVVFVVRFEVELHVRSTLQGRTPEQAERDARAEADRQLREALRLIARPV